MTHDDLIEAMADRAYPGRGDPLRMVAAALARANITRLCEAIPGLADVIDGKAAIVPVQPFGGMVDAGARHLRGEGFSADCYNAARQAYAVMLAASPYRSKTDDR